MPRKKSRRKFGMIRQLPSGQQQASYFGPDGTRHNAPQTFDTVADAEAWLTLRRAELLTGEWTSPNRGKVLLADYARQWLEDHECAPRTRDNYDRLIRLHISPLLGHHQLGEVDTETVRRWLTRLRKSGRGKATRVDAYVVLRAILNTAKADGRIRSNPCQVKSAGSYEADERPVASIAQVYDIAGQVPKRYRALVLTAAFTSVRWGELVGLRRAELDLAEREIRVRRKLTQRDSGELLDGDPKSRAGRRVVSMPIFLVDELRAHLDEYVSGDCEARVFTTPRGKPLRRDNWHRDANWRAVLAKAGVPKGFHFHDLRHTGNHLAAQSGANLKELMRRMGHSTVDAALVYLHATDDRDREIADRLAGLVDDYRNQSRSNAADAAPEEVKGEDDSATAAG